MNKSSPVRNKSNQVKNMPTIHIQGPLICFPILKARIKGTLSEKRSRPMAKILITATFIWNKIKTHYREIGKQVKSSNEKVKSCRNKSSQVMNLSSIHIQRPLFLLTIAKALITATFVWNKKKMQYRDKGNSI